MFSKEDLIKLANHTMPFGKYAGRVLIDLPEAYLLWFSHKGFPRGELGYLLELALEIKRNGQAGLLQPLKGMAGGQPAASPDEKPDTLH